MAESALESIGFGEFTTNLILKVFDGLVAANLSQTEAYVELVQSLSKTLSQYVSDTTPNISGAEVLQFLATFQPHDTSGQAVAVIAPGTIFSDVVALNTALQLPVASGGLSVTWKGGTAPSPPADNEVGVPDSGTSGLGTVPNGGDAILFDAVRRHLAAKKYSLLQQMVNQGLLRMVIPAGLIETRLTYNTTTSSFYENNQATYSNSAVNFAAQAKTGGALARWVSASASVNYTSVNVKTTNERSQDYSGSQVNVFGLVRIEFKTDFLPLGK